MACYLALSLVACGRAQSDAAAGAPRQGVTGQTPGAPHGLDPTPADFARMGEGFVVWESNRTGDWRIWIRNLDGSGLAQLSPDEGDRQHCCPHVAPDGTRLTYLSLPAETRHQFPLDGLEGELRLLEREGGAVRTLVRHARAYGDDRAVVWRSDRELIYVDAQGRPTLLDLDSGAARPLLDEGLPHHGWLVDATLRWAVTAGTALIYAPYDARSRTVAARSPLGGCAPYFTHDGEWGFWVAGAGGPINRIDLATGRASILLGRHDPRMSPGHGYLYFPMISRDSTLFAVGASAGDHDHYRGNYDVFIAELDPVTLELASTPLRYTTHPATDRFPDVWRAPLPLGRLAGEAPFTVALDAGRRGPWEWDFGDGTRAGGERGEHTYQSPGTYSVRAVQGDLELKGQVRVAPAAPPAVVEVEVRRAGVEVVVRFDEPVEVSGAEAALASRRPIAALRAGEDGRSLVLELGEQLHAADRLRLSGINDRAQRANALEPVEVEVPAPAWPTARDVVVFAWETANRPNLVFDTLLGADRAVVLEARGRGRLDHDHALVLGGGSFAATQEAAGYVLARTKASSTFSIEAMVTPERPQGGQPSWIASFGRGPGARNLALGQMGDRLVLRLVTIATPKDIEPEQLDLGPIPLGKASHVVVTYLPGLLAAYVNGKLRLESDLYQGDLNRWHGYPLVFGDDPGGGADWAGRLEGIAIYDRVLEPGEVRESFLRYRELVAARPEVGRLRVEGRVVAVSTPPTLRQISPYREGLVAHEIEVDRVLEGSYEPKRLRVARWAIQDAQALPSSAAQPGDRITLTLEPFAANPQLEPLFLADTLDPAWDLELFYAIDE